MSTISDQLLTLLLLYGYPILFVAVLTGAIGVPLPVSAVVMAAGGLAAEDELGLGVVLTVVLAAAVLGDCLSYLLVRWAGEAMVHRYGPRLGLSQDRIISVRDRAAGRTGLGVFVTRWLLTPLALPMNVVAGLLEYPVPTFLLCSLIGEALWTGGYVGAGYLVGASWTTVSDIVSDSSGLLAGIGLLALAGLSAWFFRSRNWL